MLILKNISDLEKNYPDAHLCLNMFPLPPYLQNISLMREARPFEWQFFLKKITNFFVEYEDYFTMFSRKTF